MRKKQSKQKQPAQTESNNRLLDKVTEHIQKLWTEHQKRFMEALEGSDRKQIVLHFRAALDCADVAPVVDTVLKFKDKDTENDMEVTKFFTAKTTFQFDDPSQGKLFDGEAEVGPSGANDPAAD
jgi:hypothetical protein